MKNSIFYRQAELLLKVLPIIYKDKELALKGGTAINFFVRNMPRLSVDIDLVYLPIAERETTLTSITAKLRNVGEEAVRIIQNTNFTNRKLSGTDYWSGILIQSGGVQIKVEPNTTIRGSVYPPEVLPLCKYAEDLFELSLKSHCLSIPDLYGGKICAALDRQHPRDLFDMKLLFENEGLTDKIRKAFIVYLISHNRPIVELLNPGLQDIEKVFLQEFTGMTNEDIKLKDLLEVRGQLISSIKKTLTENEIKFLISFKKIDPDWTLLELNGIERLPAVLWKLRNLERMDRRKHQEALDKLQSYLMS